MCFERESGGHDFWIEAIFYAAGPDFRRKTLKEVDAIDVAPTVAELLDIKPPRDAQGRKIQTRDEDRRQCRFPNVPVVSVVSRDWSDWNFWNYWNGRRGHHFLRASSITL